MEFELFTQAALAEDLTEFQLRKGDLVTIVDHLPANAQHEEGYVVEVFDVLGKTLYVISLHPAQLQALKPNAIPAMRELAAHS